MATVRFQAGAAWIAAAAAVPAFLAATGIVTLIGSNSTVSLSNEAFGVLLIVVISIPFGAMFSALPLMVGISGLGLCGNHNFGARMPVVWALAGAAMAGLPLAVWNPDEASEPFIAILALTGATCALIARSRVIWIDD